MANLKQAQSNWHDASCWCVKAGNQAMAWWTKVKRDKREEVVEHTTRVLADHHLWVAQNRAKIPSKDCGLYRRDPRTFRNEPNVLVDGDCPLGWWTRIKTKEGFNIESHKSQKAASLALLAAQRIGVATTADGLFRRDPSKFPYEPNLLPGLLEKAAKKRNSR